MGDEQNITRGGPGDKQNEKESLIFHFNMQEKSAVMTVQSEIDITHTHTQSTLPKRTEGQSLFVRQAFIKSCNKAGLIFFV